MLGELVAEIIADGVALADHDTVETAVTGLLAAHEDAPGHGGQVDPAEPVGKALGGWQAVGPVRGMGEHAPAPIHQVHHLVEHRHAIGMGLLGGTGDGLFGVGPLHQPEQHLAGLHHLRVEQFVGFLEGMQEGGHRGTQPEHRHRTDQAQHQPAAKRIALGAAHRQGPSSTIM